MSRGQQNVLIVLLMLAVLFVANHVVKGRPPAPETPSATAPSVVVAPVPSGKVTSGFGARWGQQHYGTDIAAPIGTPIRAISDGTVIVTGPASGFGLWVQVRHTDGTVSVYGHMNTIARGIRPGVRVKAGQQIATVGMRGQSTGPHLHIEIWPQGRRALHTDPVPWFARHKTPITDNAAR